MTPGSARLHLLRAITSLPLVLLPACPAENDAPIVLFGGARYDWQELSHRVSWVRAATSAPAADGTFVGELGLIGGNFSTGGGLMDDAPVWTLSWLEVESDRIAAAEGEVELLIDPTGRAERTVEVDLVALGLDAWPEHTVALRGYRFDTDQPLADGAPGNYDVTHGWTPQGFGAGVGEATRAGDTLSFSTWLHFKAGLLDRPPMNANVPYAIVGGTVLFSVIGSRSSVSTLATHDTTQMILRDAPFTDIAPLPAADRTLVVQGDAGFPLGVPLLRSFDLTLNRDLEEEGRYLRAFGARLESTTYTADSGRAEVLLDLFCSHSSLVEEGDLQVDTRVEVELLQVRDPEGSASLLSASEAADIGPLEVPLP